MRRKKDKHEEPIHNKHYSKSDKRTKSGNSILHKHQQKLEEFRNKDNRLKTIDTKLKTLRNELRKAEGDLSIKHINNEGCNTVCVSISKTTDEIRKLEQDKRRIMSGQDEIDYLLESSILVSKYIELDAREKVLLESSRNDDENAINSIMEQKFEVTNEYTRLFDEGNMVYRNMYINMSSCADCGVTLETSSGFLVCPDCGRCTKNVECAGELSYKEMQEYDFRPQYAYEKMTHLEEWLRRFQAKENRCIPQDVLDKVVLEAKKERIKDLNQLTEDKVKRYLKKLSLNIYYDNVIGIINRINGRPPFKLTTEIEDKIKTMFQQIQVPFEKHKPASRRNFLSYGYTLHKFFQILGLHEFATYFPLLKSDDKLRQQDDIFKKIVADMVDKDKSINWVFYPSI